MIESRRITHTRKDRDGDILVLCSPGHYPGHYWSPVSKNDTIRHIESNLYGYHVDWPDGVRTDVRVVDGPNGKYLRTDKDATTRNNLDDLPDC